MDLIHDINALRDRRASFDGASVGLVPTMGNLHEGHLALVRACREATDVCVVSIFVNPTQFGVNEDFSRYPRTLAADQRLLTDEGVDVVFAPNVEAMYPDDREDQAIVSVPALADTLCGASRPGHFTGVATVVAKLFNIVAPHKAFFGEKDWQQLCIVKAMARQLDMPVEVFGVPTVRAASGLALSSRNEYLSEAERDQAALINRCLNELAKNIEQGERDYAAAVQLATEELSAAGFNVDYIGVRDADRLTEPDATTTHLRILAAARLGKARLIDNVGVGL